MFFKKKNKATQSEAQTTEEKKVTYTLSSIFPSKEIEDEALKILYGQEKGK